MPPDDEADIEVVFWFPEGIQNSVGEISSYPCFRKINTLEIYCFKVHLEKN